MNLSVVFYLFAIPNILIISFIAIGEAGSDSESEYSRESYDRGRMKTKNIYIQKHVNCPYELTKMADLSISDQKCRSWDNFAETAMLEFPPEFEQYTEEQKLYLCRRVWAAYTIQLDEKGTKRNSKVTLEECENNFTVQKMEDGLLEHKVDVYFNENLTVENVSTLGCQLVENVSTLGCQPVENSPVESTPRIVNVFVVLHKTSKLYYLLHYFGTDTVTYIVLDLVENIELPQISTPVNTETELS